MKLEEDIEDLLVKSFTGRYYWECTCQIAPEQYSIYPSRSSKKEIAYFRNRYGVKKVSCPTPCSKKENPSGHTYSEIWSTQEDIDTPIWKLPYQIEEIEKAIDQFYKKNSSDRI